MDSGIADRDGPKPKQMIETRRQIPPLVPLHERRCSRYRWEQGSDRGFVWLWPGSPNGWWALGPESEAYMVCLRFLVGDKSNS